MDTGMGGIQTTMPVAPVAANGGYSDGMNGGMSWIWIILLLVLLGGNGLGNLGGNNAGIAANGATNLINNDFLYTQQKVDRLDSTLNSGFDRIDASICNLGHQVDSGFCGVNRNIDQVRFEMAQNTCTITNAINASTQNILGYLTSQEIANWRERALSAENRENNANQTAAIVNTLRPYPNPSYLTVPPGIPFGAYPGYGVGFAYGGHHGDCCGPKDCGCGHYGVL